MSVGVVLMAGYLYHESETWTNLKTLIWHNK